MHQPESAAAAAGMEETAQHPNGSGVPISAIVFQCGGCRRVVGDSLALINADEELRNITLHGTGWLLAV